MTEPLRRLASSSRTGGSLTATTGWRSLKPKNSGGGHSSAAPLNASPAPGARSPRRSEAASLRSTPAIPHGSGRDPRPSTRRSLPSRSGPPRSLSACAAGEPDVSRHAPDRRSPSGAVALVPAALRVVLVVGADALVHRGDWLPALRADTGHRSDP